MEQLETVKVGDLMTALYDFAQSNLGELQLGVFQNDGDFSQEVTTQNGINVISIENNFDGTSTLKIWDFDTFYDTGSFGDPISQKKVQVI